MGNHRTFGSWQEGDQGRTVVDNRLFLDAILWLARSAAGIGQLADGPVPVPTLDDSRCLGESFQSVQHCPRFRICPRGRHHLQDTCGCDLSKAGLEVACIGRSKGGLTTKIHAAVDGDNLRAFIADDLGATAHIKRNSTRLEDRYIDWMLYKERHSVECFFNLIKASSGSPCDARKPSAHSKPSSISHAQWLGLAKCRRRLKHF